jgi:23S rRNA (adenine2030-N6)-methyltransferase
MALSANIPPKERRGLVLIDPPYEETTEFARLADRFAQAHRKWPSGLYLLWYPIKARNAPDALARRLRQLDVPKILRCEFSIAAPRADTALAGSGLIIVNPPFPLERELQAILAALTGLLAPQGRYRLDWLARE